MRRPSSWRAARARPPFEGILHLSVGLLGVAWRPGASGSVLCARGRPCMPEGKAQATQAGPTHHIASVSRGVLRRGPITLLRLRIGGHKSSWAPELLLREQPEHGSVRRCGKSGWRSTWTSCAGPWTGARWGCQGHATAAPRPPAAAACHALAAAPEDGLQPHARAGGARLSHGLQASSTLGTKRAPFLCPCHRQGQHQRPPTAAWHHSLPRGCVLVRLRAGGGAG
jgi:hypothetical protein